VTGGEGGEGGRGGQGGATTSILDSLRRIIRTLRVASRATEKEFGLSAAQLFVLHALANGPAMSINEVAERTRTHQSSVSVVVQRLVERGLVARDPAPGDARRTALSLTPAARRLLVDTPDAPTERLIGALERMSPAARTRLARALAKLVADIGAAGEPPSMLFEDDASAAVPGTPAIAAASASPPDTATRRGTRRERHGGGDNSAAKP
jgi:DNA-binding MarR family transcriptional regulator